MIRIILFCLILILPLSEGWSQQSHKMDSLLDRLHNSQADTNRVKILFKLTWEQIKTRKSLEKAEYYADSAASLSKELDYAVGKILVNYYYGVLGRLQGEYSKALDHFQIYIDYFREQGDSAKVADALYHKAVIFSFQGRYEESLENYLKILSIYEANGDQYMVATTFNSIGIIYKNLDKLSDALNSYQQALSIFDSLNTQEDKATCLNNIGNVYSLMKEYEQALVYYKQALSIDRNLGYEWGIAYQQENMATVYSELGQFRKSLQLHLSALDIRKKLGQKKEMARSLIKVGTAYYHLNSIDLSLSHLLQGIAMAEEIGAKPELRDGHLNASDAYAKIGNFNKAYQHQQNYIQINDSIINEEMTKQINELQARYETEKKEQEIKLLHQERLIQKAELLQQTTLKNAFVIGFILLGLFIIYLIWNYKQKMKTKQLIAQKNEEINRQKILELQKNQRLLAMDAMISGQEKERKRIAQDLHDGLGVMLSSVQNQFSRIGDRLGNYKEAEVFDQTNSMLSEACQEVRKIAHNMMPGTLLKLGLVSALKDLCLNTSESHDFSVDFQCFGLDHRLSEVAEVTLYRMVQEALRNISKHAQARQVIVQLMKADEQVMITIEDDGVGFDVDKAISENGMGLKNFQSRVQYLNGNVTIQSEKGKGTCIQIEVPIASEIEVDLQS